MEMRAITKRMILTPILIVAVIISYYLYLGIYAGIIIKLLSAILLIPALTITGYCLIGIIKPNWVMSEPGKLK